MPLLEKAVNRWLVENREVNVLDSNMDVMKNATTKDNDGFTFYLLYEGHPNFTTQQQEELKAVLPEAGESLVTDVNLPQVPGVQLQ